MSREQIQYSPSLGESSWSFTLWVTSSNHYKPFQGVTPFTISHFFGKADLIQLMKWLFAHLNKGNKSKAKIPSNFIHYQGVNSFADFLLFLPFSLTPFLLFPLHPSLCKTKITSTILGPGFLAQLVRVSSQYAKVTGLISIQGTYKMQPMNAPIRGATNQCTLPKSIN